MNQYDIIIGIPSYNEADCIAYVTNVVDSGLSKYYPNLSSAIVNVDNHSMDDTKSAFLQTKTKNEKIYISTPLGVKGKGNNFYNLFNFAKKTRAKAVIVVDADLKSITPEWVKKLADPIFHGHDFVSPLYIRHKYDGTITNHLVFPIVYSLFNHNIRQPIGGDFALSDKIIEHYLFNEWAETTKQYGIDIFLTMNSIIRGFKSTQVLLGSKIHKASAPKLGPMFTQVVNTLFGFVTDHRSSVLDMGCKSNGSSTVELPDINPPDIDINPTEIKEKCIREFQMKKGFLSEVLPAELYQKLCDTFSSEPINIDSALWSEIVYTFLNIYPHFDEKMILVESLKPLYFARCFSFINETNTSSSFDAEKIIIDQAEQFKKNKHLFCSNSSEIHIL